MNATGQGNQHATQNEENKGWKYLLFKKKYPEWITGVVVAIFAVLVYMWIRVSLS